MSAYRAAFEQLRRAGEVFPCWCSRNDLDKRNSIHRGACVAARGPDRAPAWRVRMPPISDCIRRSGAWAGSRRNLHARSAISSSGASKAGSPISSPSSSTMRRKASPKSCAAPTCSIPRRGRFTCSACSVCRRRVICICRWCCDADGQKLSKQDRARPVDRADPAAGLARRAGISRLRCARDAPQPEARCAACDAPCATSIWRNSAHVARHKGGTARDCVQSLASR